MFDAALLADALMMSSDELQQLNCVIGISLLSKDSAKQNKGEMMKVIRCERENIRVVSQQMIKQNSRKNKAARKIQ